jgi:hypothetical protein
MAPDYNTISWLSPWRCLTKNIESIVQELHTELCPQHILYGISVRAIACRQDCDEFAFELLDGTKRFAIVHLTYTQHREIDPRFPSTELFSDWKSFESKMSEDNQSWLSLSDTENF